MKQKINFTEPRLNLTQYRNEIWSVYVILKKENFYQKIPERV